MAAQDEYVVEILKDVGLVSHDDVVKAREVSTTDGITVLEALIQMGAVTQKRAVGTDWRMRKSFLRCRKAYRFRKRNVLSQTSALLGFVEL